MDPTPTEIRYLGTRESFQELRAFLDHWVRKIEWIENDERDNSVTMTVLTVRGDSITITLQQGETLYATDSRLI